MEVVTKTAQGDKGGNTAGVLTQPTIPQAVRRLTPVDLDGPVGAFLADALCFIAPNSFNPGNWKGKLSNFIASKITSFIVCGRSVGLAHIEQDVMTGEREAKGLFLLAADGGTDEDMLEILKAQKQWARDSSVGFRLPPKEYSSLTSSKMQQMFKPERREELFIPPLTKK